MFLQDVVERFSIHESDPCCAQRGRTGGVGALSNGWQRAHNVALTKHMQDDLETFSGSLQDFYLAFQNQIEDCGGVILMKEDLVVSQRARMEVAGDHIDLIGLQTFKNVRLLELGVQTVLLLLHEDAIVTWLRF